MTEFAASPDGTRIAYERSGDGPPVIVVAGMFGDRTMMRPLAERLGERLTAFNYDRRGRGRSENGKPYAAAREIEDLRAVIDAAGGRASVYGMSSGACLALEAAAAGAPIDRLILHEPPYGEDGEEDRREARELADAVAADIAADRRAAAIERFLVAAGAPPQAAAAMSADPGMQAVAPTMVHDFAVVGHGERGGTIPADVARSVAIPTLLLAGTASPPFFRATAERLCALLPSAQLRLLEGHGHDAPPDVVAPVVIDFLA